jgi:hypothetical protein
MKFWEFLATYMSLHKISSMFYRYEFIDTPQQFSRHDGLNIILRVDLNYSWLLKIDRQSCAKEMPFWKIPTCCECLICVDGLNTYFK